MGTHISKVRSITLDTWEPDQIEVIESISEREGDEVARELQGEGDVGGEGSQ